ncbi:hypothetical protein AMELA_G00052030 [Ameiurus melas]|uniref:Uncharacterized protein n=1 Tax=Ameiurus melas TaxID=219545 RepID=A0A7J6B630_AMEME|nr:hypothetical protein AMELA_G00052030 [Ameiurus melas]
MKSNTSKPSQIKNIQKAVQCDPDSEYITLELFELQKLFWQGTGAAYTHVNEVWPSVYIGDEKTALERHNLGKMAIMHILNAVEGKRNSVTTGPDYYGHLLRWSGGRRHHNFQPCSFSTQQLNLLTMRSAIQRVNC